MRSLIPFVALALTWCAATAQSLPARFVFDDGAVALFLDESGTETHAKTRAWVFPASASRTSAPPWPSYLGRDRAPARPSQRSTTRPATAG